MNLLRKRSWIEGLAVAALAVVCFEPAARAQDPAQPQGTGEPARAVRLSYVDGQVSLSQGGQVLAQQAVANAPLLEGMQLTTADSGKAEIQFEDGSVARLSPDSSLTLQVLQGAGTTARAVLVLNSGLAYFEFQGGGQAGEMSVQFGDSQVTASGFMVFRVGIDLTSRGRDNASSLCITGSVSYAASSTLRSVGRTRPGLNSMDRRAREYSCDKSALCAAK